MPNWPCTELTYPRFEVFIQFAESVTLINYAWQIIPHNKIKLVVLISYDSKCDT